MVSSAKAASRKQEEYIGYDKEREIFPQRINSHRRFPDPAVYEYRIPVLYCPVHRYGRDGNVSADFFPFYAGFVSLHLWGRICRHTPGGRRKRFPENHWQMLRYCPSCESFGRHGLFAGRPPHGHLPSGQPRMRPFSAFSRSRASFYGCLRLPERLVPGKRQFLPARWG